MIKWPTSYAPDDYRRVANEVLQIAETPGIEEVDTLGLGEAAHMLELAAAALASRPVEAAQGGVPPRVPNGIDLLIAEHASMLDANPYTYFELAYTRRTNWMAWICDKPREEDPNRKVLARGQGDTPYEACDQALAMLAAAPEVK